VTHSKKEGEELRGFAPIGIMEWWNIALRGIKTN